METIISINEVEGFKPSFKNYSDFDGYEIQTTKQVIKLGISNGQNCCENWGYFMTNDNLGEFIGAELVNIEIVNEILDVTKLVDVYEGGCMFVNLKTSNGDLQFVAYNPHNGYYGHTAIVESSQLTLEDYL